ncbi:GH25 family lysozyme [Zhengella sp. ZM62]|uniref:glycoside hydrolase family 25 protein n=1 Tax=Zhengella sedimenti TaxID=3390035 RepID=UPI0039769789
MRIFASCVCIAALFVAGCTSSSGVDALDPSPGMITGSIGIPVPGKPVGPAAEADAGPAAPVADHAAPGAETQRQIAALAAAPAPEKAVRAIEKSIRKPRFSDAKPVNFGPVEPEDYPVHGVDVSRWQGEIDWLKLKKEGANFVYIKATEGGDHLDPSFMRNWRGAQKAGVARGAYHFFYWCTVAEVQADWFIRNVPKEKGTLPPVIDVEWNAHSKSCPKRPSREVVLAKMKVFMEKLERHYGQQPVIYTAPDFYRDNLRGEFKNHSFWLRAVAEHPSKVYPGREFAFWQYSGTGLASGVDNHIDLNVFNGSKSGWQAWLKKRTR